MNHQPDNDTAEPTGSEEWRRAAQVVLRLRATGAYDTVADVWAESTPVDDAHDPQDPSHPQAEGRTGE